MTCITTTILTAFAAFWSGVYITARLARWYYRSQQ